MGFLSKPTVDYWLYGAPGASSMVLDSIEEHLIAKAVGNDPRAVTEMRRQLEAGIDTSAVVRHCGLEPTSRGIEPPPANGSVGTKVVTTTPAEIGST